MKKIDRIMQYLDKEAITPTTFERKTKLSNGYFKNTIKRKQDITDKILDRIKENAPDDYYKIFPEEKPTDNGTPQTVFLQSRAIPENEIKEFPNILECIKLKSENGHLKQRISDLERTIADKMYIIDLQKGMIHYEGQSKVSG